ncbi:MAG TPA: aminopeptidase [Anaerolineales bacterium]|nr:aminopeptidase [Anaerolineales bacterium]HNA89914.1 aminopeptidase [Anaerolineales bacterium]HNB37256.1 aminopeptidase [Anaerolineales bacterium]HNC08982.1 aminopeptidase [Anaerolineales bacterium]
MADIRVQRYAKILVEHSARVKPGDRILLEGTTAAEPLLRELYIQILEKGGHPHLMMALPGTMPFSQDEMYLTYANDAQLDFVPTFYKLAYEQFEGRVRIHSATNTKGTSNIDPSKIARRAKATGVITDAQFRRGATDEFKWCTTLYPTEAYAQDAGMSLMEYEDFVFGAVHAHEENPIAFWQNVKDKQQAAVDFMKGKSQVTLHGPNVDLTLSVKGRTFMNSYGTHNMPDGEIYTGPVEESVNGWVKFTYPANYQGTSVEGAELTFSNGRVTSANAEKNLDFLLKTLDSDERSRYLGEFAIGTNFDIQKFTGNILFDEKIGGSFHMALGNGYPETGSKNKSVIHWDMICDLRTDSEILVDGELFYKNGEFVFGK